MPDFMTTDLSAVPVLSVENVTIGYRKKPVQSHVSFDIARGSIVSILGGSGCGKSTLLKSVIGLLPVIDGDIRICGDSIVHCPLESKKLLLRKFGVAFQNGALFRSYTLYDNLALPLREFTACSEKEIEQIIHEKLSVVGLENAADKMPSELSGGMVKRAAVARAMVLNPEIVFLDEPSAGLDPLSAERLDQLIMDIRRKFKTTIVLITHELASIFKVSDRILFLGSRGEGIVADGKPEDVRQNCPDPDIRTFLNSRKVS